MKKVILLLAYIITSCASIEKIEPSIEFRSIDLRRFAKQDFLFTMENYTDPHLVLGIVSVAVYASGELKPNEYGQNFMMFDESILEIDEVLNRIYKVALEYNGDAFVNMYFERVTKYVRSNSVPGIKISGTIIKRETKIR